MQSFERVLIRADSHEKLLPIRPLNSKYFFLSDIAKMPAQLFECCDVACLRRYFLRRAPMVDRSARMPEAPITIEAQSRACRYPFAARTMPQRCTVKRSSEPNTRRSNAKPMSPITATVASITSTLRNSRES